VSTLTNVTIVCDGSPGADGGNCGQSDTAPSNWTAKDLRAQLTSRGWRCGLRGKDYCPRHALELASQPSVRIMSR